MTETEAGAGDRQVKGTDTFLLSELSLYASCLIVVYRWMSYRILVLAQGPLGLIGAGARA